MNINLNQTNMSFSGFTGTVINDIKSVDYKKIDYKIVLILILAVGLVLSFFVGHKIGIDYHKDDIKALHAQNDSLSKDVVRIVKIIEDLTIKIDSIAEKITINNQAISETQSQLEVLNNKKNEVYNTVNHMSATDVSKSLDSFLNSVK